MKPEETNSTELSLSEAVVRLEAEVADYRQKYLSLAADLENARKRAFKEYENIRFDAAARILKPLLDVVDDFDRALEIGTVDTDALLLIRKSLEKLLEQNKVAVINCAAEFDPEKHEAVMHVADSQKESGSVVTVLQKGYCLQDKVLRPAKVSVAQ